MAISIMMKKLQAFLDSTTDAYAILQLRRTDETIYERFESYEALKRQGKEPDIDHYDVVYMAPLSSYTDQTAMLEGLYTKFNVERPEDFRGHSLSVSDIVALKTDAVVSFHYVDSIGFQELQGFMKPENYLKNAEMAMEDDYGMLDGVINNGKAPATEERSSVLAQLKEQPVLDSPHKPLKAHLEREME
ncbi:YodL domain-containing protein [Enterocloster clostridioformis]|uniref:YodL domain-containing protein n=1 Tax=Enterocloster clostridioformis TaxID=1531 RepID=UPI00232EAEA3|nr:YodL domain-containing protein [Enterocloster clostridioformis]MDB2133522.1 YodL domain-containing protein [Enterocloster clostridioformis]